MILKQAAQTGLAPSTLGRLPPEDVYAALGSSPRGLSSGESASRLLRYGHNRIQRAKGPSILSRFSANYTHLMALLLWAGGGVAFLADMPQLGLAVWLVNVINGLFSFWQEFKAEKAMEALGRLLPTKVLVVRGGHEEEMAAEELVPGDVMILGEGDRVPADARVVEESGLRVDESALTGESRPVGKTCELPAPGDARRDRNMVFAGSSVTSGDGRAVIFATGMHTEFGRIARLTQSLGKELSPLQREIQTVTRVVSAVAVGTGLLFFGLALWLAHMGLAESFIFSLGMIVAFVPEGLLPTVTLALAMGMRRMASRNALVKRLSAVETLGCASVICTDKTGTVTKNEMTVQEVWLPGRALRVSGTGYAEPGDVFEKDRRVTVYDDPDLMHFALTAQLCNNAKLLSEKETGKSQSAQPNIQVHGDPTESSLLVLASKAGLAPDAAKASATRLFELPFEARRKRMTVAVREGGVIMARHKGAPSATLPLCSKIQTGCRERPLTLADREEIERTVDDYARNGFRVLALAMRELPTAQTDAETLERDMVFLGLAAIMDPPRPEVPEAVSKCDRAGIRVIMITGDHGLTAESVARRIGLFPETPPRILTGEEIDAMSDDALKRALRGEVLFARAAPEHKLRVVAALQEMGEVVAVTGDGVNDAPALKKADIGVAMGKSGADVAREAADMVLADDNFASIVNAVEEGRTVYANIRKFTSYIFTSNTPEAVPFILHALSGGRIPLALTVMQILAVDLGTDILPALALGADPPEPTVMDRPPRRMTDHVIDGKLLRRAYFWLGPFQSLAAMAAFYFQYWSNGYFGQWLDLPTDGPLYLSAMSMTLACIVTTQIGNLFAQRSESASIFQIGWFTNRLAWLGVGAELLTVAAIIYVPLLGTLFNARPFPLSNWLFLFACSPLLLLVDETRKVFARTITRRRRSEVEAEP